MRSFIHASLTLDTERGRSRMLVSSPMTSAIGRTVGSTWSLSGTSLTVYFSSVVTFCFSAVDAVVTGAGVVAACWSAGGGVDDWARSPTQATQAAQNAARDFKASSRFLLCMIP
jgi:hypothetical protein